MISNKKIYFTIGLNEYGDYECKFSRGYEALLKDVRKRKNLKQLLKDVISELEDPWKPKIKEKP